MPANAGSCPMRCFEMKVDVSSLSYREIERVASLLPLQAACFAKVGGRVLLELAPICPA